MGGGERARGRKASRAEKKPRGRRVRTGGQVRPAGGSGGGEPVAAGWSRVTRGAGQRRAGAVRGAEAPTGRPPLSFPPPLAPAHGRGRPTQTAPIDDPVLPPAPAKLAPT